VYFTLGVPGFADCLKKQHCFRKSNQTCNWKFVFWRKKDCHL